MPGEATLTVVVNVPCKALVANVSTQNGVTVHATRHMMGASFFVVWRRPAPLPCLLSDVNYKFCLSPESRMTNFPVLGSTHQPRIVAFAGRFIYYNLKTTSQNKKMMHATIAMTVMVGSKLVRVPPPIPERRAPYSASPA